MVAEVQLLPLLEPLLLAQHQALVMAVLPLPPRLPPWPHLLPPPPLPSSSPRSSA